MPLLTGEVQPAVLTLLSSTSKPAVSPLWGSVQAEADPSFVGVLYDDEYPGAKRNASSASASTDTSAKSRPHTYSRILHSSHVPSHALVGSLPVRIVHIQSPRPDTYIYTKGDLGVTLPYIGFQVKPLGHRGFGIELDAVDYSGKRGTIRLSTWKKTPELHATRSPPLLTLPLALPDDSHKVTDWTELSVHLPSVMALFRNLKPIDSDESDEEVEQYTSQWRGKDGYKKRKYQSKAKPPKYDLPGAYCSTTRVKVYASCRLRRVWFSAEGDRSLDAAGVRDEWALYTEEK